MSKFSVELGVFKRQISDAENILLQESDAAGTREHPEFLHLRRLVRELHRTIDALCSETSDE